MSRISAPSFSTLWLESLEALECGPFRKDSEARRGGRDKPRRKQIGAHASKSRQTLLSQCRTKEMCLVRCVPGTCTKLQTSETCHKRANFNNDYQDLRNTVTRHTSGKCQFGRSSAGSESVVVPIWVLGCHFCSLKCLFWGLKCWFRAESIYLSIYLSIYIDR